MISAERYRFDRRTQEILERLTIPFAVYQYLENCARIAQDHFSAITQEEGLTERLDAVIAECAEANDGKTLPIRIGIYPDRMEQVEIGTAYDRAAGSEQPEKEQGLLLCLF